MHSLEVVDREGRRQVPPQHLQSKAKHSSISTLICTLQAASFGPNILPPLFCIHALQRRSDQTTTLLLCPQCLLPCATAEIKSDQTTTHLVVLVLRRGQDAVDFLPRELQGRRVVSTHGVGYNQPITITLESQLLTNQSATAS